MKKTLFIAAGIILLLAIGLAVIVNAARAGNPCEKYYFGLGVPQDYKKAFDCYSGEKKGNDFDIIPLVLMYLNGEGTKRDPKKALESIEEQDAADPYNKDNVTMSELRKYTDIALKNPGMQGRRVDYSEVALTTQDMEHYTFITNKLDEQKAAKELEIIKKGMTWREAGLLKEIQEQFEIIKKNDGQKNNIKYIGGTISGSAAGWTESYLMDRHNERIKKFIIDRSLEKAADKEFLTADADMNDEYKKVLKDGEDMYREEVETGGRFPDVYKNDYPKAVKTAQKAWLEYRDKWVELLKLLKPKGMEDEKTIEVSVKTFLTKERLEELVFDPLGGGD